MALPTWFWRHAPLWVLRVAALAHGGFLVREKLGMISPPWLAYGLLTAAEIAGKANIKEFWAVEFGVASGRGLRRLVQIAESVSAVTGIKIKIAGFDTAKGMPHSEDYRDHPEAYQEGDFPMTDMTRLIQDLDGRAELIVGDIGETAADFVKYKLNQSCPLGFAIIDVDTYNSSIKCFRMLHGQPENYLPMVPMYFDDCHGSTHYNRFAGELLAIDEFNGMPGLRRIDIDRSAWNKHRRLGPQLWHHGMHILHVFDHPWRVSLKRKQKKILPER